MLTDNELTELEALLQCRMYYDAGNGSDRPPSPTSERMLIIDRQIIKDLIATVRELRERVTELEAAVRLTQDETRLLEFVAAWDEEGLVAAPLAIVEVFNESFPELALLAKEANHGRG